MINIQNKNTVEELQEVTNIRTQQFVLGSQISNVIVPTVEINPKLVKTPNVWKSGSAAATGAIVAITSDTRQDFYLTYFNASFAKNAACDIATGAMSVTCYIDGALVNLLRFSVITLTAQEGNQTISLDKPIKIDRGTSISIQGTFGAGVLMRCISVGGFYL
jgi:hypothetical protein